MNMSVKLYRSEGVILLYGLLSGYVNLNSEEINKVINHLINNPLEIDEYGDVLPPPNQAPQTKNNNTVTACLYESNSNSLTIIVSVAQNSAGSSYQESIFNKSLSLSGTVPVSGLGDKAFYDTIGGGKIIEVIKGNVEFILTANNGSQATLTSMAQTMISNF
jgi:hypothetical protein